MTINEMKSIEWALNTATGRDPKANMNAVVRIANYQAGFFNMSEWRITEKHVNELLQKRK